MEFISSFIFVFVIAFLALIYLYKRKLYIDAVFLFLTFLSYPLALILKWTLKVPRPEGAVIEPLTKYDAFSFPSTHTVVYTVFWGYLIYLSFKIKKADSLIIHALRILSLYFIFFVGWSRIYLGVHTMKDVIGGYVIGSLFLFAVIKTREFVEKS